MPNHSDAWERCAALAREIHSTSIKEQLKQGPDIATTIQDSGLTLDYKKQFFNESVMNALLDLARDSNLAQKKKDLFSGAIVNPTEERPALHTALRTSRKNHNLVPDEVYAAVQHELDKVEQMSDAILNGELKGASGKAFTDLVYLGVGGSNLGPEFVLSALHEYKTDESNHLRIHFVSAMDGLQLMPLLESLDAETTLMAVCSKSFGTKDTLLNANTLLAWFAKHLGSTEKGLQHHTLGVSANPVRMDDFGIPRDKQLLLWDWVGGRYSLWSAIGLPIALRFGMAGFRELLAGAESMDTHFLEAPDAQNIATVLGLLAVWNTSFLGIGTKLVLPYDSRLKQLPEYLAQLNMESLGKHTTLDLKQVAQKTGSMLWGAIGSNAQHSFYQLMHQGTENFYCDFIVCEQAPDYSRHGEGTQQAFETQYRYSHANCMAQADLLAFGQDSEDLNKRYPGNHPSVTITLAKLSPFSLGQLIALYEHKTYVASVILNINAFDQYGVEQGKVMAEEYYQKYFE
ncbi:MAG: glucose-6-phosphate isomerase [Gammaproteobacteria bacterium]|nr:glucose-6-phosphate isomerase [Gammaproteobacteria bacterium]